MHMALFYLYAQLYNKSLITARETRHKDILIVRTSCKFEFEFEL